LLAEGQGNPTGRAALELGKQLSSTGYPRVARAPIFHRKVDVYRTWHAGLTAFLIEQGGPAIRQNSFLIIS